MTKRKKYEVWCTRFVSAGRLRSGRIRWRKGWVTMTAKRCCAFKSMGYRIRVDGVEDRRAGK